MIENDMVLIQALAEWLGVHALAVFFACLIALLVLESVTLLMIQRYGGRIVGDYPSRTVLMSIFIVVGAGMLIATATVFAEMMEALGADEEIGFFDERLTQTLAIELPAFALRGFGTISHLGDPITLTLLVVVIAILLLVWRHSSLAFGWTVACAGGALLNQGLKQIFERVRPVHDHGFAIADGYSFPSGHTSGAVVVYGMLAYLCIRLLPTRWDIPAVVVATTLAFSIGWSRVFLQVHWASDVVAGFASGLAWLTVCIVALEMTRRSPQKT